MVTPDSSTSVPARKQTASPTTSELRYPSEEIVPDSEDETASMLTGAAERGPPGGEPPGNRHGSEGDRRTSHQPAPDGPPASTVLPPRMTRPGGNGQNSMHSHAASDANRRAGDRQEPAKTGSRRERNEQYTGEKRRHPSLDALRRDSPGESAHSSARTGGETEAHKGRRSPDDVHGSRGVREDKGVEGIEGAERRGGTGGENRQPGSSSKRPYDVVVRNPPGLKDAPQRKPGSSPTEAMPRGPTNKQGPAGLQRHTTPRPHGRPEGYSNPNDQPIESQDHRSLGAATAQTSSYPPSPDPDTDEIQEDDRQRAQQGPQQASFGKGLLGKIGIGNMWGGGGSSAPSECKCKEHEVAIARMEETLRYQQQENQRLHFQRDNMNQRLQNANREIANLTDKLRFAQNELTNVHQELVDAKALSDTRGKELLGAQTFLTKADAISVSEVVGLARTVNNEILQTAASLSDGFSPENYMDTEDESRELRAQVENGIGPELTKLTADMPDKSTVSPLLAQIILQALLCSHLQRGIDKWYEGSRTAEKVLIALYDDIRQTENQAVSGRWRALTRARLRPQLERWMDNFSNDLYAVMHLAGWTFTDPELRHTLSDKLQPVFKAAEKLRKAIGEQFTSADIQIAIPDWYMPFNPRDLEDDWGDSRSQNTSVQDVVGGTTGIGLQRRVAHDNADEIISYDIILPPKVILISSLKEIAEPPPPRPRRTKPSGGGGPGASG